MPRLATGVDLVEIARFEQAVARHGERFLDRIYTARELESCREHLVSLAVRWAAKEAVAKALGTGIGEVAWTDIEVLPGASNEPKLHLLRAAARKSQELGLHTWSLSLSHTDTYAVAVVIALGSDDNGQQ